jgi:hypothetical protein
MYTCSTYLHIHGGAQHATILVKCNLANDWKRLGITSARQRIITSQRMGAMTLWQYSVHNWKQKINTRMTHLQQNQPRARKTMQSSPITTIPRQALTSRVVRAYYALKDGRVLTRSETIGNAKSICGYRAYLPNDAFSKEWKDKAVNQALGTDKNDGLTIREIQMQQDATNDTSCVSSKPAAVKVSFAKIVGSHLTNNTPAPLNGESSHSFLRQ